MEKSGEKVILMGNEAIVRGALEAGVEFVSTYPGTPSSEIGNIFYRIGKNQNVYFEFSTNEKVALEAGIGASFSGLKTLVAMKNFGLNVCSDSLLPFLYTGTKGPTVIITADDPSCHSSAQSEENTRPFAYLAHIPILEPSTPQECKDFVKQAFLISEKYNIPVLIRNTTRVSHQRAIVELGQVKERNAISHGKFVKDNKRFVTLPPRVLEMKKELLEKIKKIGIDAEKSSINQIINQNRLGKDKIGIITSGVSYLHVMESLKELNLSLPVFKLGFFHPLPEQKIKSYIKKLKKVLIVEELEPFLQKEIERIAKETNCKLEIFGKDVLSEIGEMKPEFVEQALLKILHKKPKIVKVKKLSVELARRSPQMCPGCPYWLVVSAIKGAVDTKEVVFGGDIGCYMLLGSPQVGLQDYLLCMGSSIGLAHGIKKATGQKLITFIGDSTFFHAGLPALINAVFNGSNPLIIILANYTTAMTGHQPHPSVPLLPNAIDIEKTCRALGVKNLVSLAPDNQEEFKNKIREFMAKDEVSVIISKKPCIFVKDKYAQK